MKKLVVLLLCCCVVLCNGCCEVGSGGELWEALEDEECGQILIVSSIDLRTEWPQGRTAWVGRNKSIEGKVGTDGGLPVLDFADRILIGGVSIKVYLMWGAVLQKAPGELETITIHFERIHVKGVRNIDLHAGTPANVQWIFEQCIFQPSFWKQDANGKLFYWGILEWANQSTFAAWMSTIEKSNLCGNACPIAISRQLFIYIDRRLSLPGGMVTFKKTPVLFSNKEAVAISEVAQLVERLRASDSNRRSTTNIVMELKKDVIITDKDLSCETEPFEVNPDIEQITFQKYGSGSQLTGVNESGYYPGIYHDQPAAELPTLVFDTSPHCAVIGNLEKLNFIGLKLKVTDTSNLKHPVPCFARGKTVPKSEILNSNYIRMVQNEAAAQEMSMAYGLDPEAASHICEYGIDHECGISAQTTRHTRYRSYNKEFEFINSSISFMKLRRREPDTRVSAMRVSPGTAATVLLFFVIASALAFRNYTRRILYRGADKKLWYSLPSKDLVIVDRGRLLREGSWGVVYEGELQRIDGEVECVAVKQLVMNGDAGPENGRGPSLLNEIEKLANANHTNMVKFFGVVQVLSMNENKLCIVMEKLEMSLSDLIHSNENFAQECTYRKLIEIFLGIVSALKYIHEDLGYVHYDLKPSNVLLNAQRTAKVTDFGWSRSGNSVTAGFHGTKYYMAPEIALLEPHGDLNEEGQQQQRVNWSLDVYSLGVLMLECVLKAKPKDFIGCSSNGEMNIFQLHEGLVRSCENLDCHGDLKDLIRECLQFNPEQVTALPASDYGRPRCSEIERRLKVMLGHRWTQYRPPYRA